MTNTTTPDFRVGETVRVKATGLLIELDDVNPNPNYEADEEFWGEGFRLDGAGNVIIDLKDEIEKVDLKPLPTAMALAQEVSSRLHSGFDDVVNIHETSVTGATVEVCARDSQGIELTFQVTVHHVQRATL